MERDKDIFSEDVELTVLERDDFYLWLAFVVEKRSSHDHG